MIISKMKLNPINPKNNAAARSVELILANNGLKNKIENNAKMPVFNTGTIIEAKIEDNKSCFFLSKLATIPATIPAIVVLSKHARTVPTGLIEKKMEIVEGENKVNAPETNPKNPPTTGPYNMAPKEIIINEKFKLANPPGITI